MKKRILYFHGFNGSPRGQRHGLLTRAGYQVDAPELPFARSRSKQLLNGIMDPRRWGHLLGLREATHQALESLEADRPDVIVATSLGCAVALSLGVTDIPMVLLAPAWNGGLNPAELIRLRFGRHRETHLAQGSSLLGSGLLALMLAKQAWPDLAQASAPLVVLHDAQDEVVPIAQTERLIAGYGRPQGGWTPNFLEMLHREVDHSSSRVNGCQITIQEGHPPHHPMHGPTAQQTLLKVLECLSTAISRG